MAYRVTLIPGDGTGPEIVEATRKVLEATGVQFDWDMQEAGVDVLDKYGTPLPAQVLDSIKRNKVALKGPITTPLGKGFRSVNVALRKELELYACLRPCKTYPGVRSRYEDVDLIVVRENMEDLYAGVEFQRDSEGAKRLIELAAETGAGKIAPDSAISIKSISVSGSDRIIRWAFEYAKANNRRKVTAVHKANILKFSDGLFLQMATDIAKEYPEIEYDDRIVDNMSMQLVQKPEQYDVMVCPNLFGDILSDLCAGLVGGLGVAPGGNFGAGDVAVFEPTHGSAPKYAGQNRVNPSATILSGMLMLRHLGEREAADRLERAFASVVAEGKDVTYDLKPTANDPTAVGTQEFAQAIIRRMEEG
jgi:isocitrate dehydrogenase (NAD+)